MPEQAAQPKPSNPTSSSGNKTLMIIIIVVVVLIVLGAAGYFLQQKSSEKATEKAIEDATGADVDVSEGGDKVTIETDEGKVTVGKNEVPDSFPSDITVYSGAEVTGTTETSEGVSLLLTTSDSVEKVNSFYKADLAKNGWTISSSSIVTDSALITAEKGSKSLIVTVGPDKESGKTGIAIVVKTN